MRAGRFARIAAPMTIQITPSILNADFANLAAQAAAVSGADWLHVDVMDNHFVPNLTLGAPVVASLAKATSIPIDCHLMIDDPDRWAPAFVEAGAGSVTFHIEAAHAPVRLARELRAMGARAGMALNPATAIEPYEDLLAELDMVLVMTVEPGFGGQRFLDMCLPKIARTRALIDRHGLDLWVQVGRRGLHRDDRAMRPGGCRRVRRRLGGLRRRRPGRDGRAAAGAGDRRHPHRIAGRRGSADRGRMGGRRVNSSRAPGSVKLRTGGYSPRPGPQPAAG